MPTRTIRSTVRFSSEFLLYGLERPQPPGEYAVEVDEEAIEGNSVIAYRRVATFLHLPAVGTGVLTRQVVPVDPVELDQALARDSAAAT